MKRIDWISIIIIGIMISATIVFCFWYYTNAINECVSDPLTYGANAYSNLYDREVIGVLYIITDLGSVPIYFNNVTIIDDD